MSRTTRPLDWKGVQPLRLRFRSRATIDPRLRLRLGPFEDEKILDLADSPARAVDRVPPTRVADLVIDGIALQAGDRLEATHGCAVTPRHGYLVLRGHSARIT